MKRNQQKAFTLIELLITLAILLILLMVALPSFNASLAASDIRSAQANILSAFRYAKTTARTAGQSVTITITTNDSSNTISFSLPTGNNVLPDNTKMNQISLPEKISVATAINTYTFKPNGVIDNQSTINITSTRLQSFSKSIQIVDALGHVTVN